MYRIKLVSLNRDVSLLSLGFLSRHLVSSNSHRFLLDYALIEWMVGANHEHASMHFNIDSVRSLSFKILLRVFRRKRATRCYEVAISRHVVNNRSVSLVKIVPSTTEARFGRRSAVEIKGREIKRSPRRPGEESRTSNREMEKRSAKAI